MLSRVADSIYWMSRYIERAENVARFIRVNLSLSLDLPGETNEQWWPLAATSGDDSQYLARYGCYTPDQVIDFLTLDVENPNSIASCLHVARENARSVRSIITSDMWEQINEFYLMVQQCGGLSAVLDDPDRFFQQVNVMGQQFHGVTDATMTHGEAWHFCELGRMIERADKTSRILDVKYFILLPHPNDVGSPYDDLQWRALLRSASALEMYRQRHGQIQPIRIVQFLVLDPEFPRAVLHCLTRANQSLHHVTGTVVDSFSNLPEQRLGQVRSQLAYMRAEEIVSTGLHEFVDRLQKQLNLVGDAISATFFDLRPLETRRQNNDLGVLAQERDTSG